MGKQWKQCQTLVFWAPKITADGDCSHEIFTLKMYKLTADHVQAEGHQGSVPKEFLTRSWDWIPGQAPQSQPTGQQVSPPSHSESIVSYVSHPLYLK